VGQLAPFDLLVLLILSETVQNSLIGDDTSLVGERLLALREPSIEEARDALDPIENDGQRACEIIASLRGMFKKETQARNLNR